MADHGHNKRADFSVTSHPIGVITRGTTGHNRLRRSDRWGFYHPRFRHALAAAHPLAVDVGYGASDTTTIEWARWLRRITPDCEVVGLEIDPARLKPARDGVRFELGGFELAGYRPHLVRAFNVLRQYDVDHVIDAWAMVCSRLAPGGVFIEGTCDEIGRRCSWVVLDAHGPQTLTLAWNPWDVDRPSELAERLPKILIHRNVAGERIHRFLRAADRCWDHAGAFATFGPRVRWVEAKKLLAKEYAIDRPRLLRDNTVTVRWDAVAP